MTIVAFIPDNWLLVLTMVFQILSGISYSIARELREDLAFRRK